MGKKELVDFAKEIAKKHLGYTSRLISGSKGQYRWDNPRNFVKFNANVCTLSHGKIWYGDVDVTLEEKKLLSLAKELKENIYLLSEMDARSFHDDDQEKENQPDLAKAAFIASSTGESFIGDSLKDYYVREGGRWLEKEEDEEKKESYKDKWPDYTDKYKKEDFTAKKLPKIESSKSKVSPLEKFYKHFSEGAMMDIYLLEEDYRKLEAEMRKWFLSYHKLKEDSYALSKNMAWLTLSMPSQFYECKIGPSWSKKGYMYLKKSEKPTKLKKTSSKK
jgi:hypothetical protein